MNLSNNPFDNSFDYSHSDSNDFHDCSQEDYFTSESTALLDNVGDIQYTFPEINRRRCPTLTFNPKTVEATPALQFDVGNKSVNDFLSPLETALLEENREALSSSDEIENEEGVSFSSSSNDSVVAKDIKPSFYSKWWPQILSSAAEEGDEAKSLLESNQGHENNISVISFASSHSLSMTSQLSEENPHTHGDIDTNYHKVTNANLKNPLEDAPEVMKRMSAMSVVIANNISSQNSLAISKSKRMSVQGVTKQSFQSEAESSRKVLKKIIRHSKDGYQPWTAMIILEELGTASSWVVLLLPYIALFIALVFDSDSLWTFTSAPLITHEVCSSNSHALLLSDNRYTLPLSPLPEKPCSYNYTIIDGVGLLSHSQRKVDIVNDNYVKMMFEGVAFTSGPITDVPVLSTFLYGDVEFSNLSSDSVELINGGNVSYSTLIFQQRRKPLVDDSWFPISISKPKPLKIACRHENQKQTELTDTRLVWKCISPRLVDVIFSDRDTSLLTGGAIRVDIALSVIRQQSKELSKSNILQSIFSKEFIDNDKGEMLPEFSANGTTPLVSEIAMSASYSLTHLPPFFPRISIFVRLCMLSLSCVFIGFWIWSMGPTFVCFPSLRPWQSHEGKVSKIKEVTSWWECPWISFPERWYLLLLLFTLLSIQNPVMAYMFFHPGLYENPRMHFIADSVYGIGIHGLLCLWLCLFHGLSYHTAEIGRKRAQQQKHVLELRRTAKYLASVDDPQYKSCSCGYDSTSLFFEKYGDIDGYGTAALTNFRMKHDPCGSNWADFLLPKLLLFFIGVFAVLINACFRFGLMLSNKENDNFLYRNFSTNIYVVSSLVQITILSLWIVWITQSVIKTGSVLRKQPFLSTRGAQLAFRVLTSIMVLGVASILIPCIKNAISVISPMSLQRNESENAVCCDLIRCACSDFHIERTKYPTIDILLRFIERFTHHLPYSGTDLRPGEIIYITVNTLVAAFIFLPSSSYFEMNSDRNESMDKVHESVTENQRRDKRRVVSLAKYTHTWRVFPLPIDKNRNGIISKRSQDYAFQIDRHFNQQKSGFGRGMIYMDNYVPVFCVELALWLLECSWQAYFAPEHQTGSYFAPGIMNLNSIGLKLEASIYDDNTDTVVFVSTNKAPQVDGDADSIIVVSFGGTATTTNIKTDMKCSQVPLPKPFPARGDAASEYEINIKNESLSFDPEIIDRVKVIKHNPHVDCGGFKRGASAILMSAPFTRQAFPRVHSGFIEAYLSIRIELIEKVVNVLQRQLDDNLKHLGHLATKGYEQQASFVLPKIYICGHSLGGALAQLLALDIACNVEVAIPKKNLNTSSHARGFTDAFYSTFQKKESHSSAVENSLKAKNIHSCYSKPTLSRTNSLPFQHNNSTDRKSTIRLQPPIAVYTFGQPRLGNRAFSRFYKANVPHTFRVVTEGDAVTGLPIASFSGGLAIYKHAGLDVILDEGNTGNTLVGPTVVETLLRFSKVRTNFKAHIMEWYREGLRSALTQDELEEFHHGHGNENSSADNTMNSSLYLPDWVTNKRNR